MTIKGTNMVHVKKLNRASILELLYSHGGLSRKEIAARIKLTPAAITLITNDMIKEGLLKEIREESNSYRVGRKEIIIDINYNNYYAVGVNINLNTTKIVCIDLKCRVLFEYDFPTSAFNSPEEQIVHICGKIEEGIQKTPEIDRKRVVGVGVGVRGIVDDQNGISIESFGMWEDNIEVRRMFGQRLSMPVEVDNNVRSIACGQLFYSERKPKSMLLVKYGPGIGGALIIGEKLYTGYKYRAAELGHIVVDPLGAPCRCKKCGCLETIASYDAIERSIKAAYSKSSTPVLYELTQGDITGFDVDIVMKAYKRGDVAVQDILSRVMRYFSLTIKNAITSYDPEKVVLYGEAFDNDDFLELLYDFMLDNNCYKDIKNLVVKSEFNGRLDTNGPASHAIEYFLRTGGIMI